MKDIIEKMNQIGSPWEATRLGDYFQHKIDGCFRSFFMKLYRLDRYPAFKIPDDYIAFMQQFEHSGIYFDYRDIRFYGYESMIFATIDEAEFSEEPLLWVFVGTRGDKGHFYLCCDTSDPRYGQVGEFYDSSPWLNMGDFEEIGADSFARFVELIVLKRIY